jgi:NtrC-family two-component system sensor histidine kinase KinB
MGWLEAAREESAMPIRRLQTRFILAGCLLVLTTIACGVWSIWTFAHLGSMVDRTLGESQEPIDLTAILASALEREDDALLLSLTGERERARTELKTQRQRFEEAFARLMPLMKEPQEQAAAAALRNHVDAYRTAGDALVEKAGEPNAREDYHQRVNPALRQAVADCSAIRELNFGSMRQAGLKARDEARRATWIVAAIYLVALLLSTLVAVRLARAIVRPVHELTESVEAIRRDDFARRVQVDSADELGRLADGFNRMAETLADYRNSSLGELLLAKMTLESALAAIPDPVFVVDPEGQIVSANRLARAILPAGSDDQTHRIEDLPLTPEGLRTVRETLQGERPLQNRADLSRALAIALNGRSHRMSLAVAPIPEFLPRRCGAVIVLEDVTDFVRLDELRSELVAVASHELKTPLTSLRMSLLLLQERADNLTPRQREVLAAALQGGQELADTIDELLDLTRIEAGQLRLQQERVDLYAVIDQAVRALRPRYEDAEITLGIDREASEATIRGDAARLRIVFANLLTNALKYTPRAGRVSLRVSSRQNAAVEGKALLQIAVTDTGPGIAPEFRERVFEKFFRIEHHRPGEPEGVRGAGIGLYLCRQIIEAHGGSIRCVAGPSGLGTQIAIELMAEGGDGPPLKGTSLP